MCKIDVPLLLFKGVFFPPVNFILELHSAEGEV